MWIFLLELLEKTANFTRNADLIPRLIVEAVHGGKIEQMGSPECTNDCFVYSKLASAINPNY